MLEAIRGYRIELHAQPRQMEIPVPVVLDRVQIQAMAQEIQELCKEGAISRADNSL